MVLKLRGKISADMAEVNDAPEAVVTLDNKLDRVLIQV